MSYKIRSQLLCAKQYKHELVKAQRTVYDSQ